MTITCLSHLFAQLVADLCCYHFSRLGSRSPPNTSQPPAFFSKLTESTSAIVKSKKQEMIKKMTVVGSESDFSKSDLSGRRSWLNHVEENLTCAFPITISDAGQPGTEIFNMPASTTAGNLSNI